MITLNSIQCKHCLSVITSKHVHDMVYCKCGKVAVDGGNQYLKRSFKTSPQADYWELSKPAPIATNRDQQNNLTAFLIGLAGILCILAIAYGLANGYNPLHMFGAP